MSAKLEKQINHYLSMLSIEQKEELLTMTKALARKSKVTEKGYSTDFLAELKRRTKSLENGTVQGISWEDVKKHTRHMHNTNNA